MSGAESSVPGLRYNEESVVGLGQEDVPGGEPGRIDVCEAVRWGVLPSPYG